MRSGAGPAAEVIGGNANINWNNNNININRPGGGGGNWNHNVDHRHGVRYNNKGVADRMNKGNNIRGGAGNRTDFRGHTGEGRVAAGGAVPPRTRLLVAATIRRGGDRPGAGNRPGGGGGGAKSWQRVRLAADKKVHPVLGGGGHNAFAGSGGRRPQRDGLGITRS